VNSFGIWRFRSKYAVSLRTVLHSVGVESEVIVRCIVLVNYGHELVYGACGLYCVFTVTGMYPAFTAVDGAYSYNTLLLGTGQRGFSLSWLKDCCHSANVEDAQLLQRCPGGMQSVD
jgi:hypothetical protein